MPPFRILPAGDAALVVELPERIDPELNAWCVALSTLLVSRYGSVVRDVVVGYCSVTVYFDPLDVPVAWLEFEIRACAGTLDVGSRVPGTLVEVPVRYGGAHGPDLADVASFARCSEAEVIELHAGREYLVYMVGFVPGFAYMAEVDPRIATPRRASPRTAVPAGSVAIAGGQTGIYPAMTPGGWNIIGCTSLQLYDPARRDPFLFRSGDRVRFRPMPELEISS
jgi:KipI family sensor histidine kinase inhibitor